MKPSYTLTEVAKLTASTLHGDGTYLILGISDLISASAQDAVFVADARYLPLLEKTQAGAIFIRPQTTYAEGRNYLLSDDPEASFQKLVALFAPSKIHATGFDGIHPTAVIHPTAQLGTNVKIGPHAVVDSHVRIGDRTQIGPGCYLSPHVSIGDDCTLHAHVTIENRSQLGNRVIVQPGVVIGSPGFGYRQSKEGRHERLEHIGNVIIEDDVEIGANTTIDQARFGSTRIGRGTKIDNLVQIAHNVQVGQDNLIVSQSGIAGSSSTGRWVILAGQVGVCDHVHLTDRVILAARSGVSKSITKTGTYSGAPAAPVLEYNRRHAYLRNLESLNKRVKALERQHPEGGPSPC